MNRQKLREKLIKKISLFGDGETKFKTRDIEALIYWIDELNAKLSPIHNCESCKHFLISKYVDPCYSCDDCKLWEA